jgi:peptidoglycan/LPS O-acetylase OafA/YrhL
MKPLDYRPDLDGMRGLGALVIILFHVGFAEPSGGFVTLDMFFVISGFLITRLIRHEYLGSDSFSYSNFYVRRARRLMPALFFTLGACLAVGAVVFAPHDLARFGGAVVHAVASLSNYYFWSEAGYFDAESSLKPLLHTWSLGVEEQFYLIWPACLVFLLARARRLVLPVLLGVGLFSLALNVVFGDGEVYFLKRLWPATANWFADGHSTIYFLTPFRVFEFAIGAACVWVLDRPGPRQAFSEILSLSGLLMLVAPMFIYDEATLFPSVYALPPCLGTALLICTPGARCNRLLGYRPFVGLGLASYSIYLAHQPIMAFYRYAVGGLSTGERWALCFASVAAGLAMYRWVEKPFRHGPREKRWSPAGFGLGCALCAVGLVVVSANAWGTLGWTWRYGESDAIQAFARVDDYRRAREVRLSQQAAAYFEGGENRILVIGDSLSDDLLIGLSANFDARFEVRSHSYRPKCGSLLSGQITSGDAECERIVSLLNRSLKIPIADQFWISFQHNQPHDPTEVATLVDYLKQRASGRPRFVLFGRGPDLLGFQAEAISMLADGESIENIEKRARGAVADVAELDQQLQEVATANGATFVSKFDLFCDGQRCKYFTDAGGLMFWDTNHLTVEGSEWFGRKIVADFDRLMANTPATAPGAAAPPRPTQRPPPRPPQQSASAEPEAVVQIDESEVMKMIEDFGRTLSSVQRGPDELIDESRLPYPKDRIRAALLLGLKSRSSGQERAMLAVGLEFLAFFQPGVGTGTTMDMLAPDQQPWRHHVEAEIQRTAEQAANR